MDPLKKLVFFFSMLKSAFMSFPRAHTTMSACTSVSMSPEPLPQRGAFGLSRMQRHQSGLRDKVHHAEMRNPLNCTCVHAWVCVCVCKYWQIGLWARLPHTGTSCSWYCREILGQEWGFHHKKVWISKVFSTDVLFRRWGGRSATLSSSSSGKDYYQNLI